MGGLDEIGRLLSSIYSRQNRQSRSSSRNLNTGKSVLDQISLNIEYEILPVLTTPRWAPVPASWIANGDFELGSTGWSTGTGSFFTVSNTAAYFGSSGALLNPDSFNYTTKYSATGLYVGEQYCFSAYVKLSDSAVVHLGNFQAYITDSTRTDTAVEFSEYTSVGSNWYRCVLPGIYAVAAGTASLGFIFLDWTPNFYVDGVKLELGATPTDFLGDFVTGAFITSYNTYYGDGEYFL